MTNGWHSKKNEETSAATTQDASADKSASESKEQAQQTDSTAERSDSDEK